jgi:hypothetical protein
MTAQALAPDGDIRKAGRRPPGLARLAWVTWRQHRPTLIGLGLFLGATAVGLLIARLKLHQPNDYAIRAGCPTTAGMTPPCRPPLGPFIFGWAEYYQGELQFLLPVVPVAIGMFLGAPLLAREYAAGTTRFAWAQGAGRLRTVVTKVVLLGLVVLVSAAAIGWLTQWSAQPILARSPDFDGWNPALFDAAPATEAGLALLCYAAGILAGVVTRRVVPAMAVTAVALLTLIVVSYDTVHYWLLSLGLHRTQDLALGAQAYVGISTGTGGVVNLHAVTSPGVPGPAGSWLSQGWYLCPAGHRLSHAAAARLSFNSGLMARLHDTFWVTYQPGSRYWLFQSVQGGAELLLALILGALAIWLVQRRNA